MVLAIPVNVANLEISTNIGTSVEIIASKALSFRILPISTLRNCGSSIFSKITSAEAEGEKEFPFTMGVNQFDFIDYEDFCEQVARSVSQDEVLGVINICSGHPERLADRVERFIKENHYNIKLNYGTFPDRPYDSKAVWGDDTIIQKIMDEE